VFKGSNLLFFSVDATNSPRLFASFSDLAPLFRLSLLRFPFCFGSAKSGNHEQLAIRTSTWLTAYFNW
jgi:hypothetical protein